MQERTATSADDFARQARWEMEGVRRATERYREAAKDKNPAELSPGRALLRELIGPMTAAVAAAQEDARGRIGGDGPRAVPLWVWPIQMLRAEVLAMLTLCAALRTPAGVSSGADRTGGISSSALTLSTSVRDQIELDRWTAEQERENKEAKKRKDAEHVDLLSALRRTHPVVPPRVWYRWRKKVEATRCEPWAKSQSLAFGTYLLQLLADTAPHRFAVGLRSLTGGRTELHLSLTPETLEILKDRTERAEVARPMLMPMVIPPNPWRYEQ